MVGPFFTLSLSPTQFRPADIDSVLNISVIPVPHPPLSVAKVDWAQILVLPFPEIASQETFGVACPSDPGWDIRDGQRCPLIGQFTHLQRGKVAKASPSDPSTPCVGPKVGTQTTEIRKPCFHQ